MPRPAPEIAILQHLDLMQGQVWAQAAEKAGSLELQAMIAALRQHQFDTVLGPIDFDDKGDLTVQNPVWWVWRGGTYMPLEPSP
jgi:branched-chain amino acid transport system substrate-binding protein